MWRLHKIDNTFVLHDMQYAMSLNLNLNVNVCVRIFIYIRFKVIEMTKILSSALSLFALFLSDFAAPIRLDLAYSTNNSIILWGECINAQ